jgi:hypothetical protein
MTPQFFLIFNPQAENEVVRYTAATEGVLAIALWDHNAVESEELSLQSGDVVHILDLSDPNWWWAARGQTYGWLPASYVQLCEQPFHRQQGLAQGQKFARTLTPAGIATLQHSVRANVINELVTAERDYVKLLSDLVDGYLKPMKSRPDLFSHQRIQSIFGNLEALYQFQKSFLVDLEHSLNWNALEDSVVGGCFLQHVIYSLASFFYIAKCKNLQTYYVTTTDSGIRHLCDVLQQPRPRRCRNAIVV